MARHQMRVRFRFLVDELRTNNEVTYSPTHKPIISNVKNRYKRNDQQEVS
jgi:hypothetical protein